ncbi:helix-turn-helix domain-containing protein [Derxia gummosa]|uniref:Helix-turn-helix domain-containing protein n=1 Tax=Derxia gummosa DSM 723 TaxID=1121388 RepID=A0A8B6X3C5_9BURK|nr:helix-turn-helix domain-containing protein [Derxia gummosa]
MNSIPIYALYKGDGERLDEPFHCESIASRSQLHDWEIKPHRHEHFLQLLYVRRGRAEATVDGEMLALPAGTLLTVPARVVHGFVFSRDVDGVVVTLDERYVQSLLAAVPEVAARHARARRLEVGDSVGLRNALEGLVAEMEGNGGWRGAAIAALLPLVLLLGARLCDDDAPAADTTDAGDHADRHYRRFTELLDRRYRERLGVNEYAAELGITPTHLNRICKQKAGRPALDCIRARTVVEAQRDLIYTTLGIKHIALTLGFADAGYFTRFFVGACGQTPGEFRRQARARLRAAAR